MFSRIKKPLKNEKGMIDLASIMTGAVVTGILGVVAAGTFLGVIPWFNDKSARDDLNLLKIAEDSYYNDNSKYGDVNILYTENLLKKTISPACIVPTTTTYTAYVKSKSGKMFSMNPTNASPVVVTSIPCTLVTK